MRARRNILIRGLVQGVYFRETVRRIALNYAVAGFVRNVAYDRVEIDVEAEPEILDAFVNDVLAHPPSGARVDEVKMTSLDPQNGEGFRVVSSLRAT